MAFMLVSAVGLASVIVVLRASNANEAGTHETIITFC